MSDSPTPTPDQLREHMRSMLEHPIAPKPVREAAGISLDSFTDEQIIESWENGFFWLHQFLLPVVVPCDGMDELYDAETRSRFEALDAQLSTDVPANAGPGWWRQRGGEFIADSDRVAGYYARCGAVLASIIAEEDPRDDVAQLVLTAGAINSTLAAPYGVFISDKTSQLALPNASTFDELTQGIGQLLAYLTSISKGHGDLTGALVWACSSVWIYLPNGPLMSFLMLQLYLQLGDNSFIGPDLAAVAFERNFARRGIEDALARANMVHSLSQGLRLTNRKPESCHVMMGWLWMTQDDLDDPAQAAAALERGFAHRGIEDALARARMIHSLSQALRLNNRVPESCHVLMGWLGLTQDDLDDPAHAAAALERGFAHRGIECALARAFMVDSLSDGLRRTNRVPESCHVMMGWLGLTQDDLQDPAAAAAALERGFAHRGIEDAMARANMVDSLSSGLCLTNRVPESCHVMMGWLGLTQDDLQDPAAAAAALERGFAHRGIEFTLTRTDMLFSLSQSLRLTSRKPESCHVMMGWLGLTQDDLQDPAAAAAALERGFAHRGIVGALPRVNIVISLCESLSATDCTAEAIRIFEALVGSSPDDPDLRCSPPNHLASLPAMTWIDLTRQWIGLIGMGGNYTRVLVTIDMLLAWINRRLAIDEKFEVWFASTGKHEELRQLGMHALGAHRSTVDVCPGALETMSYTERFENVSVQWSLLRAGLRLPDDEQTRLTDGVRKLNEPYNWAFDVPLRDPDQLDFKRIFNNLSEGDTATTCLGVLGTLDAQGPALEDPSPKQLVRAEPIGGRKEMAERLAADIDLTKLISTNEVLIRLLVMLEWDKAGNETGSRILRWVGWKDDNGDLVWLSDEPWTSSMAAMPTLEIDLREPYAAFAHEPEPGTSVEEHLKLHDANADKLLAACTVALTVDGVGPFADIPAEVVRDKDVLLMGDPMLMNLPLSQFLLDDGKPLCETAASVSHTVSLRLRELMSDSRADRELPKKNAVLSAHWLPEDQRESMLGLPTLHHSLESALGEGWTVRGLGWPEEDLSTSGSRVSAVLSDPEQHYRLAIIGGHGNGQHAGVCLEGDRLWRGGGADLTRLDLLILVSCSVGQLNKAGADATGLYTSLAANGASAVVAARWPVLNVHAANFATDLAEAYTKELAANPKAANDRYTAARTFNRIRNEFARSGRPGDKATAAAFAFYGVG